MPRGLPEVYSQEFENEARLRRKGASFAPQTFSWQDESVKPDRTETPEPVRNAKQVGEVLLFAASFSGRSGI